MGSLHPLQLLAYLAVLTLGMGHALAADSLRKGSSINDGETLVSAGGVFELGFFTPGSAGRYLGIWYKKIPVRTVVWVFNRESPLADDSGVLILDHDGNLMLMTRRESGILLASSGAGEAPVAELLDSGNFVLAGASDRSRIFWQSFDQPTDTLLSGMRLGLDRQWNRQLISWRDPEDPTPGDFKFGVDPNRSNQLFLWQRGKQSWASGEWNGEGFSSAPEMTSGVNRTAYTYVIRRTDNYFIFSVETASPSRFVMGYDGQITQWVWAGNARAWASLWSYPRRKYLCEFPSACGANGICYNGSAPSCLCLRGFVPGRNLEWDSGDWSGGCQRRTPVTCGEGDGFLTVQRVTLPVTFLSSRKFDNASVDVRGCRALCAMTCSCSAHASVYGNGTGCVLWFGDLIGLQGDDHALQDFHVRVAASALEDESGNSDNNKKKKMKKKLLFLTVIPGLTVVIILTCVVIKYGLKQRKSDKKGEDQTEEELMIEIGGDGSKNYGEFSLLGFERIAAATDNFSHANKLGEGGFGPVYKGMLSEGQEIAVKRLSKRSGQGMEEFKTEILLIARLQHRNLVRLLGCCIKGEERMLIYEYMPNKSLDFFLFDSVRAAQLDWTKRFCIIEGIAQGLLYLHKHSRLRIIHRDLKASNILLDSEMNPRISDFGMARIFSSNDSEANTKKVVGTYGYMSPEYAMEGHFSVKSDVFSFGVVLLEIVSGKRNTATNHFTGSLNLLGHAWKLWNEGRELELMDPSLGDSCPTEEVSRCIHVALVCVQEAAAERPMTWDVVAMLGTTDARLPAPNEPAFFIRRKAAKEDSHMKTIGGNSINLVTMSAMDGR